MTEIETNKGQTEKKGQTDCNDQILLRQVKKKWSGSESRNDFSPKRQIVWVSDGVIKE